jgi:YVTN family beta-propeller protein
MARSAHRLIISASAVIALAAGSAAASFVNFETGQVRPLALSPDGTRLFAANTPDNRLEIFRVVADGVVREGSVPVGLEPIAVAARTDAEVWVVNHLSDSVSVVDVASDPPRVVATLLTCDEPRDIVFAGPGGTRAFVTAARRGQNCPVESELTMAGLGRAVVQVWDATNLGGTLLGGTPIANLVLFADTPRSLTRSPDGATVYAAAFHSGNETTALGENLVCDGGANASPCGALLNRPGGLPAPNVNVEGIPGPEVGLIVRRDPASGEWRDSIGRNWSPSVPFTLPDLDVFAIDAAAATPVETASFPHVGTILFDMVTNPATGTLYVSNTEARNEVRFEGPGLAFGSTTVQGHLHEARVTVISGGGVLPRHLNKHIDYDVRPAPPGVKEKSLATPVGMAVSPDGTALYVAAFGSAKIGVFSTTELENDTFTPSASAHIPVSGGGPTGLVLDASGGRLYAFTRFDNAVSVIDVATRTELAHVAIHNPEPAAVRAGRSLLYDAVATSSNGEASCSSCHVFGDFDSLAWDLGNPDDVVLTNPIPFRIPMPNRDFHPLKGPMTTQSLRGMAGAGSMHWRGDRTGGNDPGGSVFDEDAAFKKFNVAFPGLIGREAELTEAEMQAFTDFILTVTYPPNPIRRLNGNLTNAQQLGRDLYFGRITDVVFNCNGCHTLDPANGFFGTDGFATFEGETQGFKVAHLRNVYQKVGMFRVAGPQVRGFGFLHDGSVPTVFQFLGAAVFSLTNQEQRRLEQFMLAYDSNLAPIVGQQITLDSTNATVVDNRLNLLIERTTTAGECDLVVKGTIAGEQRGAWLGASGLFELDRADDAPLDDASLRALAATPGQELTYTCVPPGSGKRLGVDRDEDGHLDRDELDELTDPANAASFPPVPTGVRSSRLSVRDDATAPIDPDKSTLSFRSAEYRRTPSGVVVPVPGSAADPTLVGAILRIYRADGGGEKVVIDLPASQWKQTGKVAAKAGWTYSDPKRLHGPIRSLTVKNGRLTIRGRGAGVYQLDGAPQGALGVRLRFGTALELCAVSPPREPAPKNDHATAFNGLPNSPALAECPDVPH